MASELPFAAGLHRKSFDPTARGMLDGVRVIDLSRLVAGNLLTLTLADHGAEVVKIEPPAGDSLLAPIMQNLVGPPLSEHVDLLRLLEQSREKREPLMIAPEDQQAVMHKTMDDHYRRVIEEPIPALGNKSPRGLVKTPKGRERVADWIKTVENHSAHRPPEDPMRGYDTSWLWRELGVEDLRN